MSAFFNTFRIDWIYLISYALDFLVVMWVLKHYLYKPILKLLDERKKQIQEQANLVNTLEQQEAEMKAKYEETIKSALVQKDEIVQSAKNIADRVREKTLEDTRTEIKAMQEQVERELASEKRLIYDDLKQSLASLVVLATGKVIGKNISAEDNQKILQETIDEFEKGNKHG